MDQESFANAISGLKELAKAYENILAMDDIREELKELNLSEIQLQAVCDYLIENKIEIADYHNKEKEPTEKQKDQEDSKFLKIYMEEIKDFPDISKERLKVIFPQAVKGDKNARDELISGYLNRIVDFARIYRNQGVLLEDLIQEGNMGLMNGLVAAQRLAEISDIESYLSKQICKAMEEAVYDRNSKEQTEDYLLKQMEEVERCISRFEKEENRKPTVEELAELLKKDVDEIKDIIIYLK